MYFYRKKFISLINIFLNTSYNFVLLFMKFVFILITVLILKKIFSLYSKKIFRNRIKICMYKLSIVYFFLKKFSANIYVRSWLWDRTITATKAIPLAILQHPRQIILLPLRDLARKLNSDWRYVLNARRIYLFHDEPYARGWKDDKGGRRANRGGGAILFSRKSMNAIINYRFFFCDLQPKYFIATWEWLIMYANWRKA